VRITFCPGLRRYNAQQVALIVDGDKPLFEQSSHGTLEGFLAQAE
jgi:hypothetical protein